jgi:hypothetical protein
MKKVNEKYCTECGELINIKAELCPKCGVRQPLTPANVADSAAKNNRWITCLLLCWFLGIFGVHRFYTGHIGLGILQLLTFGACGIWTFIDFIIIATGNFKDAQGNLIKSA